MTAGNDVVNTAAYININAPLYVGLLVLAKFVQTRIRLARTREDDETDWRDRGDWRERR